MPPELVEEKPAWFRISNSEGVGMATCAREREAQETAKLLHSMTGENYTISRVTLCGSPAVKSH